MTEEKKSVLAGVNVMLVRTGKVGAIANIKYGHG